MKRAGLVCLLLACNTCVESAFVPAGSGSGSNYAAADRSMTSKIRTPKNIAEADILSTTSTKTALRYRSEDGNDSAAPENTIPIATRDTPDIQVYHRVDVETKKVQDKLRVPIAAQLGGDDGAFSLVPKSLLKSKAYVAHKGDDLLKGVFLSHLPSMELVFGRMFMVIAFALFSIEMWTGASFPEQLGLV